MINLWGGLAAGGRARALQCSMMMRSMRQEGYDRPTRICVLACAFVVLLGIGAEPPAAQPFRLPSAAPASPSPEARRSFQAKLDEALRALGNEPALKRVPSGQRQALVEFIVGNVLFVTAHELGHALLSDMKVPVLGGEEQAADDFAVLTALKLGESDFSDRVLSEAAKGWFVRARRANKGRDKVHYYDRHGLNERRAYRIVCLLVGADPTRFEALADETKLPKDRQRTCGWQYDTTMRSWETVLAPHRRAADQPKARIEVIYGRATGSLAVYAKMFRELRLLETVAELAADRFAWPAPIVIEMRSCGTADARWTPATRRLHICYELAREFAELYRDYGRDRPL